MNTASITQVSRSQVKATRLLEQERDLAVKRLKDTAVEHLSCLLLGERLPLDIVRGTGQIIVPCNKKIAKTDVRAIIDAYPEIDIDPSPVRIKVMEYLRPYHCGLAELKAQYDEKLKAQSS